MWSEVILLHQVTSKFMTIQKQNGLLGKAARGKPLLPKKDMAVWLRFAQLHLSTPQEFWSNAHWTDKTKAERFGHSDRAMFGRKTVIVTIMHSDRGVIIWACKGTVKQ